MTEVTYATNRKALRRWSTERLTLVDREDGGVDARFVYDGSTCANMGRPLRFLYDLTLGTREDGYRILAESCTPDTTVEGYQYMCRFRSTDGRIMTAIEGEKPMLGLPLVEALLIDKTVGASCFCEFENRTHKWGLVFETIHFALSLRESAETPSDERQARAVSTS